LLWESAASKGRRLIHSKTDRRTVVQYNYPDL
jgi:hypothetical protein